MSGKSKEYGGTGTGARSARRVTELIALVRYPGWWGVELLIEAGRGLGHSKQHFSTSSRSQSFRFHLARPIRTEAPRVDALMCRSSWPILRNDYCCFSCPISYRPSDLAFLHVCRFCQSRTSDDPLVNVGHEKRASPRVPSAVQCLLMECADI